MKIALVSSHGGHLTEIKELLPAFAGKDYFFVTYEGISAKDLPAKVYSVPNIGKNIKKMLKTWFWAWKIIKQEKPSVIFSTGAEIAIPFCYLGKLFFGCKIIYIECSAQVFTASFTGKVIYPVADLFLVQWSQLLKKYGKKAGYVGGLI